MTDPNKPKAEAAKVRADVHARAAAARTDDGGSYVVDATGQRSLQTPATAPYVHDAAKHQKALAAQRDEIATAQAEADARAGAATSAQDVPAVSTDPNTSNTGKKR